MKTEATYISYRETKSFSNLVIDYLDELEFFNEFIQEFPSIKAIENQIHRKQKQPIDRELLYKEMISQYDGIEITYEEKANLELLKLENTFTICTAHQPNIFTGYLYFVYKIIHAIKLAKECNALYTDFNFVPVYYMGSEDNDIEEIGTFHYNGKTFSWNTNQRGACGRMKTEELKVMNIEVIKTLNENVEDEKFLIDVLKAAYDGKNTLAEATRVLVHALFGKYGLLIIDGDSFALKEKFKTVIEKEIFEQASSPIVSKSIEKFSAHYKVQANPRNINLFYLKDNLRERIEKKDDNWIVVNTEISFTKEEIETEIKEFPNRLSPNVILRPLYQETILPNIAFIGGGGELAYWLELKSLFDENEIVYPLLFLRNSVLWIDEKTVSKMNTLSLDVKHVFLNQEEIFKKAIKETDTIHSLDKALAALDKDYESIIALGDSVSANLQKSMLAHRAKAKRIEDRIVQKFKAQLKKNHENSFHKIQMIKQQVAPNGNLQERYDNFLSIYKKFGRSMFTILLETQQGFGRELLILKESTT